ncbi:efflux RND transporter periplasmic adaptor subunit [Olivibacter sitiensis]|uniref:efflux RND transporter periplasmic adaptor subunit n=1 Tax=Olivibacter sitiensis TaxID=376470 RepID=UPI0004216916|nr:efflux RND transporter periplasmic adaptor subunit [Olivibacter sitiensis]
MKKGIITIIIIIAVAVLIGWVLSNNKKKNEEATRVVAESGSGAVLVNIDTVKKQSVNLDFSSNGNFAANQDLSLLAENSGRITRLLVDEGSRVSKGQVLARIDDEILTLDVQSAEDAYNNAKTDLERYESSFKTGGVTKAQLDQTTLAFRNAETRLNQAKRRVQDSYVKAPISGIVNARNVELGSYVRVGDPLFDIVDVSRLKLKVTANEVQVVNIKEGDAVKISSSVFPDKSFAGKINFIAPKADNTLNYPVEILVDNTDNQVLRAGMYGTATFELPQQAPTIVIPRSSFVGSVNSNQLYVVEGNKAKLKKVTAGRILGEQVEVLDGLNEGELVITSGQINLVDGTEIQLQKK